MQIRTLRRNEYLKVEAKTENAPINIFFDLVSSETKHLVDIFQPIRVTAQRQIRQGHKERCDVLY